MIVECVYRNDRPSEIKFPKALLPATRDSFYPHHFQGSCGDNLIELAGRVCYLSTKSEKSRNSKDYHDHINETFNYSVQEHFNFTVLFKAENSVSRESLVYDLALNLLNRPGVVGYWRNGDELAVTLNIRSAREWKYSWNGQVISKYDSFGFEIQRIASQLCPLAMSEADKCIFNPRHPAKGELINPELDDEIWISYYIAGASRNFSHEWIRHRFRTGVSQKSSRFCDETNSDWSWHPLLTEYWNELPVDLLSQQKECQSSYEKLVNFLQDKLLKKGIDKTTGRKLARGASRGILGTCLETEMIYSASLAQWKRIIAQRASNVADSEIRIISSKIYDDLKNNYPDKFTEYTKNPAIDGFGYNVSSRK